jgi:hypothetical protein
MSGFLSDAQRIGVKRAKAGGAAGAGALHAAARRGMQGGLPPCRVRVGEMGACR